MSEFHGIPSINEAIAQLGDALDAYERATGRGSTFVLVPHKADEQIIVFINGRPMPKDSGGPPSDVVLMALQRRHKDRLDNTDAAFLARPPALPPE